ncbi:MAG: PDDEXK family nuclease [Acidimicrobiales bacterium]
MTVHQEPWWSAVVSFAHESEQHFAELLDFYGVRWEYEPVEFILEWNAEGGPHSAFRPDFYLPDHDCFIELTTLNQKLVTRKNAKVRRLRELHPEIEVKLLYQRDYEALLAKYSFPRTSSPAA